MGVTLTLLPRQELNGPADRADDLRRNAAAGSPRTRWAASYLGGGRKKKSTLAGAVDIVPGGRWIEPRALQFLRGCHGVETA